VFLAVVPVVIVVERVVIVMVVVRRRWCWRHVPSSFIAAICFRDFTWQGFHDRPFHMPPVVDLVLNSVSRACGNGPYVILGYVPVAQVKRLSCVRRYHLRDVILECVARPCCLVAAKRDNRKICSPVHATKRKVDEVQVAIRCICCPVNRRGWNPPPRMFFRVSNHLQAPITCDRDAPLLSVG
jgi:hypothetical protein